MATKASPVKVSFQFDTDTYIGLARRTDESVAAQVRMIHSAIKPGVSYGDIAAVLTAADTQHVLGTNVLGDISHYAQTAALAIGKETSLTSKAYASDVILTQLYKLRTTGTKDTRAAMLAAFTGTDAEFGPYAKEWARNARDAAQKARDAARNAPTVKDAPKEDAPKDAPKEVKPLPSDSFKAVLASLDIILSAESDPAKLAEYAKALRVRVNRAAAPSIKPKARATVAA